MMIGAGKELPFKMIGLTGGIASGKSTVSGMLAEAGLTVIDADQLAREVVRPGTPGLAAIVEAFGAGILQADGSLDRAGLGAMVFSDQEARARLSGIVHPLIQANVAAQTRLAQERGENVVVYDAPLLVENGLHRAMDLVVVVSVPEDVQCARLCERDGLDPEDARRRLRAQLPLADKIAVADVVIDNSGKLDATRGQVRKLVTSLSSRLWPEETQP